MFPSFKFLGRLWNVVFVIRTNTTIKLVLTALRLLPFLQIGNTVANEAKLVSTPEKEALETVLLVRVSF